MRFQFSILLSFSFLLPTLGLSQEVPKGAEIVELDTQPDESPDGKFFAFVWDIWMEI